MTLRMFYSPLMLLAPVGAIVMFAGGTAEAATPKFYADQAAFQADINNTVTDDYSNPGYVFIQNNAAMSAVLGETDYMTTGFQNLNIVSGGVYCAGCNGSFELSFTTTTKGDATGVKGVGAKIQFHDPGLPYFAFITFADGTTNNIQLPPAGNFWGVSAPERIQKIHFGLSNGGTTTSGSFGIDNLMIGDGELGCKVNADCMDDQDVCTDPVCTAGKCGFGFNTAPCDDGDLCTEVDTCAAGVCGGAVLDCDDANVCTTNTCDPAIGCVAANNVDPCDDGDLCTELDVCAEGVCGGAVLDCNDDNVCTMDSCDPAVGCAAEPTLGCCLVDGDCGAEETCDADANTCIPAAPGTTGGTTTGETSTGDTAADDTGDTTAAGSEGSGTSGSDPTEAESEGTGVGSTGGVVTEGAVTEGVVTMGGAETGSTGGSSGDTSASDTAGEVSDEGCNCTSTPEPKGSLVWLMAAVGLFIRRRRAA